MVPPSARVSYAVCWQRVTCLVIRRTSSGVHEVQAGRQPWGSHHRQPSIPHWLAPSLYNVSPCGCAALLPHVLRLGPGCWLLLLPLYPSTQYHLWLYEPVIGTPSLVHHLVLYACTSTPNHMLNEPYACARTMPAECSEFYVGWAPGIGQVWAPEQAALPLGAGARQFFNLQVHYTNFDGVSGQVRPVHASPARTGTEVGHLGAHRVQHVDGSAQLCILMGRHVCVCVGGGGYTPVALPR